MGKSIVKFECCLLPYNEQHTNRVISPVSTAFENIFSTNVRNSNGMERNILYFSLSNQTSFCCRSRLFHIESLYMKLILKIISFRKY